MSDSQDRDDQDPTSEGPRRAADGYQGPGYPTVAARRGHLRKVALWATGAATVTTGLFAAGKAMLDPSCGTGQGRGLLDRASSWLTGGESQPPRLAGAPPPPPPTEDPRIKGKIAMPQHPVEPPEPRLAGEMVVPELVPPPPPEPEPDVRLRGDIAVPQHPETVPEPAPLPPKGCALTLPEGELRSVYLTGATAAGDPFTVLVRLDPADDASYQAVVERRQDILTALGPMATHPEMAGDKAAWKLVQKLVPGAAVRFAGVVR